MRYRLMGLAVLCALMAGCGGSVRVVPEAPLGSSGTVAPPPACVALRQRGGSC